MKKFFKAILIILAVVIGIVAILAAIISFRGIPKYQPQKIAVHIDYTPARVEQGTKLATLLCRNCHYNDNTKKFSGREMIEMKQFGSIFSDNITADKDAGIGNWTDGELVYFLRTGVRPDGEYIPPYMPKFVHVSDEDMSSIVAFLRSSHPWVAPDKTKQPQTKPSFLTKFLTNIKAFKPFDYPSQPIPQPDTNNLVKLGEYVALYQMECYGCHSKDFETNDYLHPQNSKGFFGGGNKVPDEEGKVRVSLNITTDEATGIGKWSEDDFVKAVKYGMLPTNQPALRHPMLPYVQLSDKEVKAIYAYLKTVPKLQHKVERTPVE